MRKNISLLTVLRSLAAQHEGNDADQGQECCPLNNGHGIEATSTVEPRLARGHRSLS
jgi:hypothetical protein